MSVLERESLKILDEALSELEKSFSAMPPFKPAPLPAGAREVLLETARRMQDNYPYPHPLYAGQMLKPPHAMARLAYMLALWINPNNHALDGGRASSALEREAVAEIAKMFGYGEHLGHLSASGTIANLEALWVARHAKPEGLVLASSQADRKSTRLNSSH